MRRGSIISVQGTTEARKEDSRLPIRCVLVGNLTHRKAGTATVIV